MEEQLKELNKTLNQMMSPEEKFTDKQRHNIRNAIVKKRSKKLSVLLTNWKPIVSTAACLLLIFAVVQVAIDNFSFNNQDSSQAVGDDSGTNESATLQSAQDNAGSGGSGSSMDKSMPALDEEDGKENNTEIRKDDFSSSEKSDGQQQIISVPLLPLNDRLLTVYEQVKADQSQAALTGLSPFEVMRIYYHAVQMEDHETQYTMLYQDPAGTMPSKKQYLTDVAQDSGLNKNNEKKLQQLKEVVKFTQIIQETPMNRKEAFISWGGNGDDMHFHKLIYDDSKGLWTVSYLGSQ